jgi:protein gp37
MAKGSETGGCLNCYAARWQAGPYKHVSPTTGEPFAVMRDSGPRWTGKVELIEAALDIPLRRRKPTTYFVDSMSDLLHESLPFEDILRVYRVMQRAPWHTYQILTKRAARLVEFTQWLAGHDDISAAGWPRQCWLGVSCENQKTLDDRVTKLLQTPAAVRFVSLEPLLGPIKLFSAWTNPLHVVRIPQLDWVIVGGESGPGARPMHPDWVRVIRDQCVEAGVPLFFKQWGEWHERDDILPYNEARVHPVHGVINLEYTEGVPMAKDPALLQANREGALIMSRLGKTKAGHLLDGQEWKQMPEDHR